MAVTDFNTIARGANSGNPQQMLSLLGQMFPQTFPSLQPQQGPMQNGNSLQQAMAQQSPDWSEEGFGKQLMSNYGTGNGGIMDAFSKTADDYGNSASDGGDSYMSMCGGK